MKELKLILPWPPSVNHYKSIGRTIKTKTGKVYQQRINSKETTAFYYQVYMRAKQQMPPEGSIFALDSTIKVGVSVSLSPPNNRPYDIDNRLKCLLDSLQHAHILADDVCVFKLFVQKMPPVEGGEVEVIIYALS